MGKKGATLEYHKTPCLGNARKGAAAIVNADVLAPKKRNHPSQILNRDLFIRKKSLSKLVDQVKLPPDILGI